jgi:hypothetical protein
MVDNFLFLENDFITKKYGGLQFVKGFKYHAGFKIGLNLLHQEKHLSPIIVETGTQRAIDDPGGCSTTLFGYYLSVVGGHLWTCDISPVSMIVSMKATVEYKDSITYITADSISFLENFGGRAIDLLFLDSMDCPIDGDATKPQEHQLKEFLASEKLLNKGAVLVMDDTNFTNGGKTRMLKNFILDKRHNWRLICDYGETVFYKVK